jgi:hypothetical protein
MTGQPNLEEIFRSVGRVEGKLDAFIGQMKVQDDRSTNLEVRVRSVENKQHWYAGAGAIIGALLGALGVHLKA